jgi:hypothetical protein
MKPKPGPSPKKSGPTLLYLSYDLLQDLVPNQQLECKSRSLLYGVATGSISFVSVYFVQRYFTKNLKGPFKVKILQKK